MVDLDPARRLGRYVLHDAIASGGMGTVHVGRLLGPAGFRRLVAIKRMSPHVASDPETVRRFRAEAAVAGRLLHPNLVSTLDVVAERGELFLVMEFVRGEALSKLLATSAEAARPVPVPIAASLMTAVLSGLDAAHEAKDESGASLGLVHRDVSPQNILVGVDGLAKIADFGIAKSTFQGVEEERDGRVRGKARYLAPEQLGYDPAAVDRRADVFAAGIVLWEALAGRALFDGSEMATVIEQILAAKVPSLRSVRKDVPEALDDVVLTALAREPADRYRSASDFAAAIENAVGTLASPRAVGEWVKSLAGSRIELLDRLVREVEGAGATPRGAAPSIDEADLPTVIIAERGGPRIASAQPARAVPDDMAHTGTLTIDAPRPAPSPRRADRVAAAIAAAAAAALGGVLLLSVDREPPQRADAPTGASSSSAALASSAPEASFAQTVASAGASAPEPAVPPSAPVASAPPARAGQRPGPRSSRPPPSPPSPPAAPGPRGKPYVADRP